MERHELVTRELLQRRGDGLTQVCVPGGTPVAREVLEHGLHAGGLQPAGKGRAIFAGGLWVGGEGAVTDDLQVSPIHVEHRGEVHRYAVGAQAVADLRGQGLNFLRAMPLRHGPRGRVVAQDFGEALHAPALEIDGDFKVTAHLFAQGVEAAGAIAQQLRVGPAGDEESTHAGLQLRARIVIVQRRRHELGGGTGADVLGRGFLWCRIVRRVTRRRGAGFTGRGIGKLRLRTARAQRTDSTQQEGGHCFFHAHQCA